MSQSERAAVFRRLHVEGLLILPNAWDAGTARLMASLGARAVATTSAGVAWAHGWADGDVLPVARLVQTARAVSETGDAAGPGERAMPYSQINGIMRTA